jgi:hypothetical protein
MGFGRRLMLVTGLLALAGLASNSRAGIFKPINPGQNPVTLEGRMCFYDEGKDTYRWMKDGKDEVGLFVGNTCIGSTAQVSRQFESHYDGLVIPQDYFNRMLAGPGLNYSVKVWNYDTGSVWNAQVRGFRGSQKGLDVFADENTYTTIPDPSTLLLMGAGAVALKKSRKKSNL